MKCESCKYEWDFEPKKRPNPTYTTCPNCGDTFRIKPYADFDKTYGIET